VDASQNVGIGTASPAGKLHVAGSGGPLRISGSGYATNPTEFTLGQYSSTTGYLQIPGGSTGRIDIWDGGTAPIAIFNQYGMGLYGTSPTSGSGITFPATQQASSNANTLDDYEEGTWTPALSQSFVGISSPTTVSGTYIKIGKLLFLTCYFYKASGATSSSGQWRFEGIPFSLTTGIYATAPAGYMTINSAGSTQAARFQANGSNYLDLYGQYATTSWTSGGIEMAFTGVFQTTA
jgi:hypothetical protein